MAKLHTYKLNKLYKPNKLRKLNKLITMESVISYIKDSYNELATKVTWSTMSDLQSNTILVLVASIIIALIIFVMDNISSVVLKTLIYG